MSLVFTESFDHASLAQKWDGVYGGAVVSGTAARNGSNGLLINSSNSYVRKSFAALGTYYIGFAFKVPVMPSTSIQILGFLSTSLYGCSLWMDPNGHLIVCAYQGPPSNPTFNEGASSGTISVGVWHYLEVKVVMGSGTLTSFAAHLDGSSFINLSLSLSESTIAAIDEIRVGCDGSSASAQMYFDDLYVLNSSGSVNNTYLGDVKVQCALPSANGTANNFAQTGASWSAGTVMVVGQQLIDSNGNLQRVSAITSDAKTGGTTPTWSTGSIGSSTTDNHVTFVLVQKSALSNFNFVNEVPADDLASYLSDATSGHLDRYTFPAITASTVLAVAVNLRASKDNVGAKTIRAATLSGGTAYDNGADLSPLQNGFQTLQAIFETDPNTSSAWTQSGVNSAEFGIKITS